jgi:hypothetical protein
MKRNGGAISRGLSSAPRRAVLVLLSMLTVASLTIVLTPSAMADPLDGSDPGATGCWRTEHVEQSFTSQQVTGVTVELLYSSGCGTAWARITCTFAPSYGCGPNVLSIVRLDSSPDGYARYDISAADNPASGSNSYFWTNQVYDAGYNQSEACLNLPDGNLLSECSAPF